MGSEGRKSAVSPPLTGSVATPPAAHRLRGTAAGLSVVFLGLVYFAWPYSVDHRYFSMAGYDTQYGQGIYRFRAAAAFALAVVVAVGALNRETAALNLSFHAALVYTLRAGRPRRQDWVALALATFAFVAVYVGLRLALGAERGVYESFKLVDNLTKPLDLLGLLAWIVGARWLWVRAHAGPPRIALAAFYLGSAPYLAMCLWTGMLHKIRLFVPIVVGASDLALRLCAPGSDLAERAPLEPFATADAGRA
ncbi:MAG: hypothetical protein EXR79_13460 [Myxococcales bacterium]|nr:hypothetical protein [Myxococcales bacterium]